LKDLIIQNDINLPWSRTPNNLITLTNAETYMPTHVHGNSGMRTVVKHVDALSDSAITPFAQRILNYSHQEFSTHVSNNLIIFSAYMYTLLSGGDSLLI